MEDEVVYEVFSLNDEFEYVGAFVTDRINRELTEEYLDFCQERNLDPDEHIWMRE